MSQVQLQQPPVACMSVACSLQTSLTGHRAKVKMLEEGSISKEVYVSSWIIIILITCSPFLALGCVSCTIFNCHCNQDGDFVMRKIGWRTRNRLINQALVTKVSDGVYGYMKWMNALMNASESAIYFRVLIMRRSSKYDTNTSTHRT